MTVRASAERPDAQCALDRTQQKKILAFMASAVGQIRDLIS